jgi:ribosomal protein L40E
MYALKISCPNCKFTQSAHSKRCKKCNCRLDAGGSHYRKLNSAKAKSSSVQIILDGKFCSSCRAKIAKEATHCPKCGKPFVSSNNNIESSDEGFWLFLLVFFIFLIIFNY